MVYANRTLEYSQVEQFLKKDVKAIIIDAYPASGVSSFVKDRVACDLLTAQQSFLYIDAKGGTSLDELLYSALLRSGHHRSLQKMADDKLGNREGTGLSAVLEGIDYLGPLLSRMIQGKSASPVYTGSYASALEEYLVPYFSQYGGKTLIAIDRVEALPETSFNLLAKLQNCEMVQCILIKTENTDQYCKLENYLFTCKIVAEHILFDRPHIKLVKELGLLHGVEVSTDRAQEIVKNNNQNIHAIIKSIRDSGQAPDAPLNTWETAAIHILATCAEPISEEELIEIIGQCETYAPDKKIPACAAIQNLARQGIIDGDSAGWQLTSHFDPVVHAVLDKPAERLLYQNTIYNYLRQKKGEMRNVRLRYQLSKELCCTTAEDAKLLLRSLLISGVEISDNIVEDARFNQSNLTDCLLAGIYFCRERKYEKAFTWINAIPKEQRTRDVEALLATLLNRIRSLDEAEEALLSSLKQCGSPAQQNLLGAFLISTYIHMERLSDAKVVYYRMKEIYPHAPMHGYLARNVASAFSKYQEDIYETALTDFKEDKDDFGYYTTLCNKGYALCKNGRFDEGLLSLEKAKSGLENFPRTNLHIIYNDLGICYFMLGRSNEASQYLALACSLGRNSMPRIFATINLACLDAVMGHTENALKQLGEIEEDVRIHSLDRVRQKYFTNRLMVEYLHGNRDLTALIETAKKYPDRYTPEHSQKVINICQRFAASCKPPRKERWIELYSPCGLAYWYMEPLKLLPAGII